VQGMLKFWLVLSTVAYGITAGAQTTEMDTTFLRKAEGTIYTVFHKETAEGKLQGCGLEFSALKLDFSTKKGAPVKLVGSFYFRLATSDKLGYMLKLGLYDDIGADKANAPFYAFVRAPRGNAPKKAVRMDAESEGYALFVGLLDAEVVAVYKSISEQKQMTIGFNRKPGQQDVTAIIDLTVIDMQIRDGEFIRARSDVPVADFIACTSELFKLIK
jgi:hypothetical protein